MYINTTAHPTYCTCICSTTYEWTVAYIPYSLALRVKHANIHSLSVEVALCDCLGYHEVGIGKGGKALLEEEEVGQPLLVRVLCNKCR